jgi:hypothetical protein
MAILRKLLTRDASEAMTTENIYESTTEQWRSHHVAQIKSPPGNGPCCFRIHDQIYRHVQTTKLSQLCTFNSTREITKRLENQSNQGRTAEVIQRLVEMLRQVNQFAESCKRMHQMN